MKVKGIASAALLLVGGTAFGAKLTVNQLPPAVQNVIKTETKNGPVNQVQSVNKNGQTVYQIGFAGSSGEKTIYLNPDGSYFQDTSGSTATTNNAASFGNGRILEVQLSQVPEAVQRVAQSETSNGPISMIEQMTRKGQRIYRVTYHQSSGTDKVVWFKNDGTYMHDAPSVAEQTAAGIGAPASGTASTPRSSLSNATKVTYDQLPAAVQKTFSRFADKSAIEDIDKGTVNGQTVYEGAFKQNNQTVELRVSENGKVIKDSEDQAIRRGRK